jgi:hypothetical protein
METIRGRFDQGTLLFLLLSFPLAGPARQTTPDVGLDNSDWWSINRRVDPDDNINPETREFSNSNLQILGIDLNDTMFTKAISRLGTTTFIVRGDASTARRQACYVSSDGRQRVHLIFEQGEVDFTFYVFFDGPVWKGSDRCLSSKRISLSLATSSGLRLGQTPEQVIAILGKPTTERKNELTYFFSVEKKTSAEDLKQARQRNPGLSEKDIRENYGSYYLNARIRARFERSKLTYLVVSKSETN